MDKTPYHSAVASSMPFKAAFKISIEINYLFKKEKWIVKVGSMSKHIVYCRV